MTRSHRTRYTVLILLLAAGPSLTVGCASRKYVDQRVGESESKIKAQVDDVSSQVEENQLEIQRQKRQLERTLAPPKPQADSLSNLATADRRIAQQALERARSTGQLKTGEIFYTVSFDDQALRFESNRSSLSLDARRTLDDLHKKLGQKLESLYLEIQGHTDASGAEDYNQELGLKRAKEVGRYLNSEHSFPAERIRVVSYGESVPIADNKTAKGRALNRRVTLVFLR